VRVGEAWLRGEPRERLARQHGHQARRQSVRRQPGARGRARALLCAQPPEQARGAAATEHAACAAPPRPLHPSYAAALRQSLTLQRCSAGKVCQGASPAWRKLACAKGEAARAAHHAAPPATCCPESLLGRAAVWASVSVSVILRCFTLVSAARGLTRLPVSGRATRLSVASWNTLSAAVRGCRTPACSRGPSEAALTRRLGKLAPGGALPRSPTRHSAKHAARLTGDPGPATQADTVRPRRSRPEPTLTTH